MRQVGGARGGIINSNSSFTLDGFDFSFLFSYLSVLLYPEKEQRFRHEET